MEIIPWDLLRSSKMVAQRWNLGTLHYLEVRGKKMKQQSHMQKLL
jgi:predicted regulator of Ras-like GTPase activity (Roadblock/LC7/MglB family)